MQRLLIILPWLLAAVALSAHLAGCASTAPGSVVNYDPVQKDLLSVRYTGSGFVWEERFVLTSSHSCHKDLVRVVLPQGIFRTKNVRGRVVDRQNDIAIIDLGEGQDLPSLPLATRDPYPGQTLTILDGSRSSRPALQAVAISPDTLRLFEGERNIRHGSSGSPVVDEKGAVVGMVFASLRLGGKELISIHPVSEIWSLVERTAGTRTRVARR